MDGDLWDAKVGDAVCVSKGGFGNHTERRFVTRTTETQVVLDDGSRWLRHGRRVAAGGRVRIFAKLWDKDDRATTGERDQMISDDEMFRRHMGKVVDQAIDEERERCALICREYAKEWAGFPAHEDAAEKIEKRIRSEE